MKTISKAKMTMMVPIPRGLDLARWFPAHPSWSLLEIDEVVTKMWNANGFYVCVDSSEKGVGDMRERLWLDLAWEEEDHGGKAKAKLLKQWLRGWLQGRLMLQGRIDDGKGTAKRQD